MGRTLAKAVALIALITVISSAQCLNFCAVHPCNEAQPAQRPIDAAQSCHHSPDSSKSEPTQPSSNCTHQPMLVSDRASFSAPGVAFVSISPISFLHSAPVEAYFAVLTAETSGSPRTQVLTNSVVLRI